MELSPCTPFKASIQKRLAKLRYRGQGCKDPPMHIMTAVWGSGNPRRLFPDSENQGHSTPYEPYRANICRPVYRGESFWVYLH